MLLGHRHRTSSRLVDAINCGSNPEEPLRDRRHTRWCDRRKWRMIATMASGQITVGLMSLALTLTASTLADAQSLSTASAPPQLQTQAVGSGSPIFLVGGGLL